MSKSFFSKKVFYIITIITLAFWIISTYIPDSGCEQRRFDGWHWDVCENMTPLANAIYVIFQVVTILGSAYVIVASVLFLKTEP